MLTGALKITAEVRPFPLPVLLPRGPIAIGAHVRSAISGGVGALRDHRRAPPLGDAPSPCLSRHSWR